MFDTLNEAVDLTAKSSGKFYHGTVTVNEDPLRKDRIKVSVPGLYDPSLGEVPWVGPLKFSPFGMGASWGVYGTPAIGSDVLILLQDGDAHYPMYTHSQFSASPGTSFPSGHSWGFQDFFGNLFQVMEDTTIKLTSKAGVTVTIDTEGTLKIETKKDLTIVCAGDVTASITGNLSSTAASNTINGPTTINGDTAITGTLTNNGVNVGSTHVHFIPGHPGDSNVPH